MHQINLERMSPVIHDRDGIAFPDTLVGTDSHTPHVDALGVIAIGVGGLEAESVMLGRASYMRLPDIVGVHLKGERQPGITATDIVLALPSFCASSVLYRLTLNFSAKGQTRSPLAIEHHLQHDPRIRGDRGHVLYRRKNHRLLKTHWALAENVHLVETYAKAAGLWGRHDGCPVRAGTGV